MKYIYIVILSTFVLTGCTYKNTSPGAEKAKSENKDKSRAGVLAAKTCDCLKPFDVLQKEFASQKISPEEYGNRLQKLARPMQDCTNKLTEETEDDADFKDEVLFKMKQLCPKVAEIIVPA